MSDDVFMPAGGGFAPHDREITQLRVPPHSIEAESSVLGGLLLDNNAWDRVGDLLKEGDFYRHCRPHQRQQTRRRHHGLRKIAKPGQG